MWVFVDTYPVYVVITCQSFLSAISIFFMSMKFRVFKFSAYFYSWFSNFATFFTMTKNAQIYL